MSIARPVVVVIEDDPGLRRLLRGTLERAGYDAREADGGHAGIALAAARKPDLVLLDLGLPDIDGLQVLQTLREWWQTRPLLVLSGRDEEAQKVAALECGADDYITKPFSPPELLARVRAALRRAARRTEADADQAFEAHGLRVDLQRREVTRDGRPLELTPNEYRILALLVRESGSLVSAERLAQELWGPDADPGKRQYLRGYVSSLRRKIEADPVRPRLLRTEAGVGYRLLDG